MTLRPDDISCQLQQYRRISCSSTEHRTPLGQNIRSSEDVIPWNFLLSMKNTKNENGLVSLATGGIPRSTWKLVAEDFNPQPPHPDCPPKPRVSDQPESDIGYPECAHTYLNPVPPELRRVNKTPSLVSIRNIAQPKYIKHELFQTARL